jgi:hypothetical protein
MHEDEIMVRYGKSICIEPDMPDSEGSMKHFVFDLDETIGSFRELHGLWNPPSGGVQTLIALLRLFPEFLRPGILPILQYLHQKKQQQCFGKFYIYTNNQCGRTWTESLIQAIEVIAETPKLVDHIICAFKIDNVIVESRRTSHWKTWKDLVRCTMLPSKAMICFIDDTYFPKMNRDRVFYLQPRPYENTLSLSQIAHRLMTTSVVKVSPRLLETWASAAPRPNRSTEDDFALSKRLFYFIREFFHMALRRPQTRKLRGRFWYNLTQKTRSKDHQKISPHY